MAKSMEESGIVFLKDLADSRRTAVFEDMDKFHVLMKKSLRQNWPDVPWPRDALHQWSRQYEYPFAFYHLLQGRQQGSRVLDAGSGLTFFPFYLRLNGFDVTCVDHDARLAISHAALRRALPQGLHVDFTRAGLHRIPYPSGYFSQLCCISVLEHIPAADVPEVLNEFSRVIAPGGIALLTMDVPLADPRTVMQYGPQGPFTSTLRECGLGPLEGTVRDIEFDGLLSTSHYRERHPELLPWAHPGGRSRLRKFKHWLRTYVLRKAHFEPLGVAAFVCVRG